MSKDIRSFFKVKSKLNAATTASHVDDEVIPESPEVQRAKKKKESKKRRVLDDSSDEEIFNKKSKHASEQKKTQKNKKNSTKVISPMKEVKAGDIFGKTPIKRTEPIVKKSKTATKTETGIHSDEEFEKSLLELDKAETVSQDEDNEDNVSGQKSVANISKQNGEKVKIDNITLSNKIHNKETPFSQTSDKVEFENVTSSNKRNNKETTPSQTHENVEIISITSAYKRNNKETPLGQASDKVKIDNVTSSNKRNNKETPPSQTHDKVEINSITSANKRNNKETPLSQTSDKVEIDNFTSSNKRADKETPSRSKSEKNEKKRDFSEFINDVDNNTVQENKVDHGDTHNKNKRRKVDKSLNESVLSDEERYEKKRMSAVLYQNYLNRTGPKHLGSKQIPEGTPTCLKGCAFLLTGVLDSFERDEITAAISRFGGTVKSGVSKKVTHVLAGDDAGPAKTSKAKELGIKIINEDEFLKLIEDLSKEVADDTEIKQDIKTVKPKRDRTPKKTEQKNKNESTSAKPIPKSDREMNSDKLKNFEEKIQNTFYTNNSTEKVDNEIHSKKNSLEPLQATSPNDSSLKDLSQLMWVDKYKPQTIKQIIGQHGDASNAKKLSNWLMRWYINRKEKIPKPSPWSKNDDGAYYKAALLSGPPGVGKTTTVALVCKELGFDMVEFNASDTRNKTLIKEQITELLTTTSLSGFAKGDVGKKAVTKKHVLVMDEVDGMAGNEDRGGLQELISLIRITAVPIICMCNDRNSQKMRSLVNYCYDLKFSKPRVDQIKSAMMSVCFKEGVKIHPDALTQLIIASNQDVRQTLNMLSLWSVNNKQLDNNDQVKKDADSAKKDFKLGPWEAVRKVFSEEEQKKMSLNDKSDLFFYDYSLAPLFVQENYLQVVPHCPKNEILQRVSMAADSLSMGDLMENRIRSRGSWNLLPMQAMFSSVIPGHAMSGHVGGQIQFPAWLGKNSRASKLARLAQEIHAHTRLSTSGSKSSIFLDYAKHLRDAVVKPLIKDKSDGIVKSLEVLQSYHLLRDDLDSLNELATWPGQRDPMILIDSKVKAAMTRTYNKEASALPYAPGNVKRSRGKVDTESDVPEDGTEQEDEEASDSDPENDLLIKKKKKPSLKEKAPDKPSSSKEKGKGKKSKS